MTKDPLVSVLMTAYNREKYIAEAVESVLNSTFRDFELIIVDDGSKDQTVENARRYLADPRVQVHVNEKNIGDYPNRNRAAGLARGKYLKYVDSDDIIYPERLGTMVAQMERFPDAGFGLTPEKQDDTRPYPFQITPKEAYEWQYFKRINVLSRSPLGIIIRATAFREAGGFSGRRFVGDFELWHKLAARFPVLLMTEGGAWYRRHAQQESNDMRRLSEIRFEYMRVALERLKDTCCPLPVESRDAAIKKVRRGQIRAIASDIRHGSWRMAWKLLCLSDFMKGRRPDLQ